MISNISNNFNITTSIKPPIKCGFATVHNHFISFTAKNKDSFSSKNNFSLGNLPKDFIGINISKLNKDSENVLEINSNGYLSEVIKFRNPKTKKAYAIKRNWDMAKAKHNTSTPVEQMRDEFTIYKKLKKIKNVPHFYYYNADFLKTEDAPLNNYIIMSWVDGKTASLNGVHYNFDLITTKKIGKLFKTLENIEKNGVIHNDLWAGNILFTEKDVNLLDFNRSFEFNPKSQYKLNNMNGFQERFLDEYLSDLYDKTDEKSFMKIYKNIEKEKFKYYKNKINSYNKIRNFKAIDYYKNIKKEISQSLENEKLLKENAIKTIFNANIRCGEIRAKHFEIKPEEALLNFQRALKVMNKNPDIIKQDNLNVLKVNIFITSKLNQIINSEETPSKKDFQNILNLLQNEKIYNLNEQQKSYHNSLKRFCEFNLKNIDGNYSSESLKIEYNDILNIKKIKNYIEKTL